MIPICLILFILFIAVITFAIMRADSAQAKVTEEFWEKERKANSPLRGDTTDLCYITIPEKFFPLNNDKINDLRDKTLVNLTGMTNTDLKLKYGILNFKNCLNMMIISRNLFQCLRAYRLMPPRPVITHTY